MSTSVFRVHLVERTEVFSSALSSQLMDTFKEERQSVGERKRNSKLDTNS